MSEVNLEPIYARYVLFSRQDRVNCRFNAGDSFLSQPQDSCPLHQRGLTLASITDHTQHHYRSSETSRKSRLSVAVHLLLKCQSTPLSALTIFKSQSWVCDQNPWLSCLSPPSIQVNGFIKTMADICLQRLKSRKGRRCPLGPSCKMRVSFRLTSLRPVICVLTSTDLGSWADEMEDMPLSCTLQFFVSSTRQPADACLDAPSTFTIPF